MKTLVSKAGQWIGRPAIKTVDGIQIMVYREGDAHSGDQDLEVLHIKFSDDRGETWSDEDKTLDGSDVTGFPKRPPDASEGEGPVEPWLYVAPNGNLILHHWRHCWTPESGHGTYQSISTDGGETWSVSAPITFTGYTGDALIYTTNDDIVYDGVIYATGTTKIALDSCVIVKSEDNGITWQFISTIDTDSVEVGIEYIGDSTIIAILRSRLNDKTYRRYSHDLGITWTAREDLYNTTPPSGRQRILTLKHVKGEADWWTDQHLIMCGFVFIAGPPAQRRNCMWYSRDGGATWSSPQWIDSATQDSGYADFFWNPNTSQIVCVSYYGDLSEAILKQYNLTVDWKEA